VSSLLPEGVGILVGVGVGAAASAAIDPAVEIPKQEAWERNPNKILAAGLMARLVAQGGIPLDVGAASAKREGYAGDKFDKLVYLEQTVPGSGEAVALWRLGLLTDDLFLHVLTKLGLDTRYVEPIVKRKTAEVLGIGDVAYGVVRGILPAPSWVPVAPPASGDKVPRFPQVEIDPLVLANKLGYDEDMLRLAVGRSGLSMSPGEAARALFREIIGPNDFLLAIAEGDLRTEWAEAVREVSRQILTAGEYAELQIRGIYGADTRRANTRKHGMSDADSDLLYQVLGRAPSVHALTTGLARGGKYPGSYTNVPEPYRSAIQRSNTREEFSEIVYADRYSYPSPFVLRSLATEGDLGDRAAVEQILLEIGWKPELAASVSAKWVPKGTAPDPWVKKADTQLWTATHKAYLKGTIAAPAAQANFDLIGVDPVAQPDVLARWDAERATDAATAPPVA
jgi:hypothetical protein